MSIIGSLLGGGIAEPIKAVGNILDKLFTSDDERLDKQLLLERLAQQPLLAQVELNKVEAQHHSMFVAGWRPYIGWMLGTLVGIAGFMNFILRPILACWHIMVPEINAGELYPVLIGMLGMSAFRTYDKSKGTSNTFGQFKVELPPPDHTR